MPPYIITTNEPFNAVVHVHRPAFTRRAVATLDKARVVVRESAQEADEATKHSTWLTDSWRNALRAANTLPESGGTITLPDRTVIEVAPTEWLEIFAALDISSDQAEERFRRDDGQAAFEQRIIDAYNAAAQGVMADWRSDYHEGDRVRAVEFKLDEGLRIWPIQSGEHVGKWRLVRVTGQEFEELSEAPFADFYLLQQAHPDATPGVNDNESVPPGTEGRVDHADSHNLFVAWDNGRRLGVTEQDQIEKV